MRVTPAMTNLVGSIHGGALASLIDIATTIAISGFDRKQRVHVSSDLNISFLSAAAVNADILILSDCIKIGKRLAFTECNIYDGDGEVLLSTGRHTKTFLDGKFYFGEEISVKE